jgi:hypothetical protein
LTPDWTPERIDEEGRRRGRAIAWARKAKEGAFKKDPFETMNIEGPLRIYSAVVFPLVALAFGKATPTLFHLLDQDEVGKSVIGILQAPALAIVLASIVSSIYAGALLAGEKNRNRFIWTIKALFGGPVAISQLRGLDPLITQGESDRLKESANEKEQ